MGNIATDGQRNAQSQSVEISKTQDFAKNEFFWLIAHDKIRCSTIRD